MPTFKNEVSANGQVAIHGISKTRHGVVGEAKQDGIGVVGASDRGDGVSGFSNSASGVVGQSESAAAVRGLSKSGRGVEGLSQSAEGVAGVSESGHGVSGASGAGHGVTGQSERASGVRGVSRSGRGVEGWSETSYGVSGDSNRSAGVRGTSVEGRGVEGWSTRSEGVFGTCDTGVGVYGVAGRSRFFTGIGEYWAKHTEAIGVAVGAWSAEQAALAAGAAPARGVAAAGKSGKARTVGAPDPGRYETVDLSKFDYGYTVAPDSLGGGVSIGDFYDEKAGIGVLGEHRRAGIGVKAVSDRGCGLAAYSNADEAIHAETHALETAAIAAYNLNPRGGGAAVFAKKEGTRGHAGFFVGNVWITGELGVGGSVWLDKADFAEDFDVVDGALAEPGTVMVMDEDGVLAPSGRAYDRRVAGVISGAGEFKPGVILDKRQTAFARRPVALLGKVYCKATAEAGAIEVGDMLTTSSMPGHAMKADDAMRAFGAVIGKALGRLESGTGLVPILVALQ